MKQSMKVSIAEQVLNVGSGFIVALVYWMFVVTPQIEGKELTFWLNFWVTTQFTMISVARGLIWRRLFNHDRFAQYMENKLK